MGCSPWGHKESDMTERLHFHFSLSCIGEGNGNPLQCSCLENPRDGEKEMATHSRVLAWRIPGTGEPGGLPSWGRTELDTTEAMQQQQQQQYIYTMDYYSAIKRNKILSFTEMWMDLQTFIQSEVSQKEKNSVY